MALNGASITSLESRSVENSQLAGDKISIYNLSNYYNQALTWIDDAGKSHTEIMIKNARETQSNIRWVDGKYYTVRACTISVSLKGQYLDEARGVAMIPKTICNRINEENATQVRFPKTANALYYLIFNYTQPDEFSSIGARIGFVTTNEKVTYENRDNVSYSLGSISSTASDANKVALGILQYTSEKATYTGWTVIDTTTAGQGFSGDFRLVCIDDYPDCGIDVEKKNNKTGEDSTAGGYGGGSFDDSSDPFGLPSLPSLGVSEVGFVNVYNPTKNELQGFADELFPDFVIPNPSEKEGLEAISENLANTFEVLGDFAESFINSGLVNYVIDCHIVPVQPSTGDNVGIKVGFKNFNYTPKKVLSDYVEFNCGSLEIAEYYQNFLDYEGTRAKLYLPFVGFVDVKPEWFQSGKLGVIYHFNIIDGSCIAFVSATSSKSKLKNTVVATFGGNCCVHMPITGVNYASMISGVVGGISGVASAGAKIASDKQDDKATWHSNIEGTRTIGSNLASALGSRPTLEQSNGYNAGMSFMCYRTPYLLIERPVASFSEKYPSEKGLPLNVTCNLASVSGFTVCDKPNLDGISCMDDEKEELRNLLESGVIL